MPRCLPFGERETERERDEQKREKEEGRRKMAGGGRGGLIIARDIGQSSFRNSALERFAPALCLLRLARYTVYTVFILFRQRWNSIFPAV